MFFFSVTVNIIEESQYPPVITPLDIEIYSYQDDFPGSIVGKVKASASALNWQTVEEERERRRKMTLAQADTKIMKV